MDSKESSSQADAVLLTSPTGHGKATEASSEIIAQEACSRLLQETSMLGQLFTSSWKNMFLILTRQGEFEPAAGEAEFNLTLWSSADAAADTQGNTPFKQWELTELFDFKASKVSVSPNWLVLGMKEEHESTQIILQFANKQIRDGWMHVLQSVTGKTVRYPAPPVAFQGYLSRMKNSVTDFIPALNKKWYTLICETGNKGKAQFYELRSYSKYGAVNAKKTLFVHRVTQAGPSNLKGGNKSFYIVSKDTPEPLFYVARDTLERDSWLQQLFHLGVPCENVKNIRPVRKVVGDCYVENCPNNQEQKGYCKDHQKLVAKHGRTQSKLFVASKQAEAARLNAELQELAELDVIAE